MQPETLNIICYAWLGLAVVVFFTMFYITAPFGRHTSDRWGKMVNNKVGWVIMEMPSLAIMVFFLLWGTRSFQSWVWILFVLWILHYANRTLVYPFRIKPTPKRIPLVIVLSAIAFNVVNAGLNGYYLGEVAPVSSYATAWLSHPRFIAGFILFCAGMLINWKADAILIGLRGKGETGYRIPRGFLFDRISSPNLFGEIIEWSGFALMAWNLPALTFMIWTIANLIPRAKNHHDWYLAHFPDYPKDRKIIIPFLY